MNPMTHAEALKALFLEGAALDLTDRHAVQYALGLAERIERTAQTLIDSLVDGNDAMRAVADEPPFSDEPFAADIARTIAARKAQEFRVGDRVGISDACSVWRGASDGEVVLVDGDPGDCSFKVKLDSPFGRYEHLWVYAWMLKHADSIPVATPWRWNQACSHRRLPMMDKETRFHEVFEGEYPRWTVVGYPDGRREVTPGLLIFMPGPESAQKYSGCWFMASLAETEQEALDEFNRISRQREARP